MHLFGSKAFWLLLALYTLAHAPMLAFGDARFWDDWALYQADAGVLLSIFDQAGVPWVGHFHLWVMNAGWWLYPVLQFVCYFLIALCLAGIARHLGAGVQAVIWIAAFGAVAPLNFARIAAINASSAMLVTSFMAAWWLLTLPRGKQQIFARIAALATFFFSFQLGSLLVIYAAPLASHAWLQWCKRSIPASRGRDVSEMLFALALLLLPVLFWCLRSTYFQPHGLFAGYNSPEVSLAAIGRSFLPVWDILTGAWLIDEALLAAVPVFAAFAVLPVARKKTLPSWSDEIRGSAFLFCALGFGAYAYFLASYPYAAVGKPPGYGDWTATRVQITAQLAFPVLLYGIVSFSRARMGQVISALPAKAQAEIADLLRLDGPYTHGAR